MAASIALIVAASVGLTPTFAQAQQRFDFAATPGRLSKAVVPSAYALALDVDPARPTFTGMATITLQIMSPQSSIVLHAHRLKPLGAELRAELPDGSAHKIRLTVSPGPKKQLWRLTPQGPAMLAAGPYRLVIRYAGRINESGEGLYRTAEKADEKADPMLATQLQAVHARTVFPGFDEPAYRASFEITVRAPKGLQVLSNMPVTTVTDEDRTQLHRFARTPSMPTYLVALAVGHFDLLEAEAQGEGEGAGIPLRIVTSRGKRDQGRFALQATQQVLGYYRDYFGQPYALPKLDQFAVPSVRFGAMEDWGLISYAEDILLVDPQRSSPLDQRRVYNVIAHEVSHQWFGNLVTASSWDEIWLNEAFATWMAEKSSAHFNPDWQVPLSVRRRLEDVLARDAGSATRAIRSGPVSEERVFDVFDSITYEKGGAVLTMIEAWLGPSVFQRGLAAYMADRKFSNATAGDLWHHLSQASGFDVSTVARSWTDQTGYPLVEAAATCTEGRTRLVLRQQRYASAGARPSAPRVWAIPVRVSHAGAQQTVVLDAPGGQFDLAGCTEAPPIVNAQGLGYYRVAYAPEALHALAQGFTGLATPDQVTLVSDTLALALAGRLPLASWFDLLAAVPATEGAGRAVLMGQSAAALERLDTALASTPAQPALRRAGRAVLVPELARLGWQGRTDDDEGARLLRGQLIRQLARFDDAEVLQRAGRLYEADRAGREPIEAGVRDAVIFAAGRGADRARFDGLRADLLASHSAAERLTLAEAMSSGTDAGRAGELMALSVGGRLPPELSVQVPGMVAKNSAFGKAAYAFALKHWQRLAKISGDSSFGIRQWLLPEAAAGFNDRADATRLRTDQRRLAGAAGDLQAGEVAEAIELRAALRDRESATLAVQLASWQPR